MRTKADKGEGGYKNYIFFCGRPSRMVPKQLFITVNSLSQVMSLGSNHWSDITLAMHQSLAYKRDMNARLLPFGLC